MDGVLGHGARKVVQVLPFLMVYCLYNSLIVAGLIAIYSILYLYFQLFSCIYVIYIVVLSTSAA